MPEQFALLRMTALTSQNSNCCPLLFAALVGAAGAVALAPYRDRRGKNGVTSKGILSRAEVIATGAVFTISAVLSQGLTFTRPPNGSAAIWSSFVFSMTGPCSGQRREASYRPIGRERVAKVCGQKRTQRRRSLLQSFQEQPDVVEFLGIGRVLQELNGFLVGRGFFFRNVTETEVLICALVGEQHAVVEGVL